MKKIKKLLDIYRFPGYRPLAAIKGKFGDSKAITIQLIRSSKKLFADVVGLFIEASMTEEPRSQGIFHALMSEFTFHLKCAELNV
jgi:hypothetical protein